MKKIKLVLSFMKGNIKNYILAITFMVLATITSLVNPLLIKIVIDSVLGKETVTTFNYFYELLGGKSYFITHIWACGIILVLVSAVNGVLNFFAKKFTAITSEKVAKNLRDNLYDHIQYLSYSYHVKVDTGDLIQRCTSDLNKVKEFLSDQLLDMIRCITLVVSALIVMLSLNVKLSFVAFIITPILVIMGFTFYKYVKDKFKITDEAEGAMTTILQENLNSMRIVKAFSKQDYEIEKFNKASDHFKDTDFVVSRLMSYYWGFSDLLCDLQVALILLLGTYYATLGTLTVGTLLAFIAYTQNLVNPIRNFGRVLANLGKTNVSLTRITEILDEIGEDTIVDNGIKPEVSGNIVFDHVSYSYEDSIDVLKDISFSVKSGQTIAILGGTGAGKTTLVNMLVRLFEASSGTITIDGINIIDINKKWLREKIGIVLQEPFLFSRSIKENISFSNTNATDEEIKEACEIACVYDVIKEFESGFETMVGEKGVTLSGGQKQRVAIARTLLNNHNIIIFDDSLSAVDVKTDAYIREQLKLHCDNITTFIISHRISTLKQADKILVMKDGTISQEGTHNELLSQEGLYKEVFDIQSSLTQKGEVS